MHQNHHIFQMAFKCNIVHTPTRDMCHHDFWFYPSETARLTEKINYIPYIQNIRSFSRCSSSLHRLAKGISRLKASSLAVKHKALQTTFVGHCSHAIFNKTHRSGSPSAFSKNPITLQFQETEKDHYIHPYISKLRGREKHQPPLALLIN